ncbi:MAG: M3 family oligoendopeptidase [Anaerolineae bacterium]|nr:M3 family oligoendopeptidase [Anaerolineae bacterium]
MAQDRWKLDDLFPEGDLTSLQNAFTELDQKASAFENARLLLDEKISTDTFLGLLKQLEDIQRASSLIQSYSELYFSENTQNQAAQNLKARVAQYMADISNRILFFELWWKQIPDDVAEQLMEHSGDYRYFLEQLRLFKRYTLSEPEEIIINLKDVTGNRALNLLYDTITNRYQFRLWVGDEEKLLTRGELMVYVRHHDPDVRARAYQELYRVYAADAPILGQIYESLVRDWYNEQVTLRKFSSPIATRNLANDIPDDVVAMLLDICQQNVGLFQRYFRLKTRWLGMPRLRRYDIYAPVSTADTFYPFEQAVEMVFDSFEQFDPRFSKLARLVFDRQHVDSQVRSGKRSGAFCLTAAPDLVPWVLLNYQSRAEDVTTMAHELGHAIHSLLAKDHSMFTFHASLPLAETASTFGEMILVDRLLQQETNEDVRRDLLFRQVDDAYATIMRQAFFAIFEQKAHEMVQQSASLDDLAQAYLYNLKTQFGEALDLSDEFRWEWLSIPHIYHVPFYVYAYAFGQLLVLSLYQQYKLEGDSFKPRYIQILAAGGSQSPARLLEDAGIDIHQPAFWQGGFDGIAALIEQLENLPVNQRSGL